VLLDARQSLWVHIPMVMVVVLSIMLLLLNCLGCAGACLLSYSLLSGTEVFNHWDNIYSSPIRIYNVHVRQLHPLCLLGTLDICQQHGGLGDGQLRD
jgi:hypothetical protein